MIKKIAKNYYEKKNIEKLKQNKNSKINLKKNELKKICLYKEIVEYSNNNNNDKIIKKHISYIMLQKKKNI